MPFLPHPLKAELPITSCRNQGCLAPWTQSEQLLEELPRKRVQSPVQDGVVMAAFSAAEAQAPTLGRGISELQGTNPESRSPSWPTTELSSAQ